MFTAAITALVALGIGANTAGFSIVDAALGVDARIGSTLAESDDESGAPNVVVLSDRFWRRQYNADPQAIGRLLTISGTVHTIAGIMPEPLPPMPSLPDVKRSARAVVKSIHHAAWTRGSLTMWSNLALSPRAGPRP